MGYFNYFIKCVIRKIVNLLFKPKMFLALLIIIGLLFAMNITARAEWTDTQISDLQADLFDIIFQLTQQVEDLEQIKNNSTSISEDVVVLRSTLTSIDSAVYDIIQRLKTTNSTLEDINSQLSTLLTDIENLNTSINNVYNKLDENQKELLTELDKDNQAVLEELNMIRDAINGTNEESTTYTELDIIYNSGYDVFLKPIIIDYEPRYSYTIKVYYNNNYNFAFDTSFYYSDNLPPSKFNYGDYASNFHSFGKVPANTSNYVLSVDVPSSNPKYVGFIWGRDIVKIEVYRSIKGIVESLNDSNSLQQQQNQLQQQQNQIQQEQNNFLQQGTSDSDVSVDSFNNIDSNDITSDGLSGVFNTIYNSITSWSSKNIVLPIPKINKSITIPANYTENMMSKVGGGGLVNIIHTVYYFIVARFIIYSITGIINSIKSGSILETDTKNNITTDML